MEKTTERRKRTDEPCCCQHEVLQLRLLLSASTQHLLIMINDTQNQKDVRNIVVEADQETLTGSGFIWFRFMGFHS